MRYRKFLNLLMIYIVVVFLYLPFLMFANKYSDYVKWYYDENAIANMDFYFLRSMFLWPFYWFVFSSLTFYAASKMKHKYIGYFFNVIFAILANLLLVLLNEIINIEGCYPKGFIYSFHLNLESKIAISSFMIPWFYLVGAIFGSYISCWKKKSLKEGIVDTQPVKNTKLGGSWPVRSKWLVVVLAVLAILNIILIGYNDKYLTENRDYKSLLSSYHDYKVRVFATDDNDSDTFSLLDSATYQMGDHFGVGNDDERPIHTVHIDAFMMSKYSVTNQQYCQFLNYMILQSRIVVHDNVVYAATDSSQSYPYLTIKEGNKDSCISRVTGTSFSIESGKEMHPVVCVSWYGAVAYCNWCSEKYGLTPSYNMSTWDCNFANDGFRLPTEAEREWAARGRISIATYYKYPWGNEITGSQANYWYSGDPFHNGTTPVGYYNGEQIPAGFDNRNGNGLYDMVGNVLEWCSDWYASDYYSAGATDNQTGPATGSYRVLRGGSWNSLIIDLRCAKRRHSYPANCNAPHIGFRVAINGEN